MKSLQAVISVMFFGTTLVALGCAMVSFSQHLDADWAARGWSLLGAAVLATIVGTCLWPNRLDGTR